MSVCDESRGCTKWPGDQRRHSRKRIEQGGGFCGLVIFAGTNIAENSNKPFDISHCNQ